MTEARMYREQHATRSAFFIPGFAIACWAPLVPFAKERAALDEQQLGILLLFLGLGSLVAMPVSGLLAARVGCRPVMAVASLLMCVALPLLAVISAPTTLALVLFGFGAAIGGMDCVMNIQAVVVERESGRPMMSGFHAYYSIGGLAGASGATALLSLGLGSIGAMLAASLVCVLATLASVRWWRNDRSQRGDSSFRLPHGFVLLVGAVCFVTFLAEGAMLDWSAVFLHEVRGIDVALAGWGFVAFNIAMTVTRLLGDGVVRRLGPRATVFAGGLLASTGLVVVAWLPAYAAACVGFAMMGMGCANIVPVMFSAAGRQTLVPTNVAIATVTTLGYAGVLIGPAAIGAIARHSSLIAAFLVTAASLAAVAVAGSSIRPR